MKLFIYKFIASILQIPRHFLVLTLQNIDRIQTEYSCFWEITQSCLHPVRLYNCLTRPKQKIYTFFSVLHTTSDFHVNFHALFASTFDVVSANNLGALIASSFQCITQFLSFQFIFIGASEKQTNTKKYIYLII